MMSVDIAPALEVAVEVTLTDFHAKSSIKRGSAAAAGGPPLIRRRRRSSLTKIECDLLKSIGKKPPPPPPPPGEEVKNDDDNNNKSDEEEEEEDDVFPEDELTAIANTAAAFAPYARQRGSVVSMNNSRLGRRESAARRNLRQSIVRHRDSITAVEAKFLRDLLEAEDVTDEAMANTAAVLETDVAYKQSLTEAEQQQRAGEGLVRRYVGSGGGRRRSTHNSHRSLRKSSVLSYEINSARSSIRLSVAAAKDLVDPVVAFDEEPEESQEEVIKPEESPVRDVAYRKELWRTKQRSTIQDDFERDEDDDESDDESSEDDQQQPAFPLLSPSTVLKQSPLVAFFDQFVDFECSQHSSPDAESSTCSDDEEDETRGNKKSDEKKEDSPVSFLIMGMCPTDENVTGLHVLTPPLMDTLRRHVPYVIRDDNFWLKYSLAQDGASIDSLLARVRSSSHTILAIETTDGEVFGSFTSTPWRHKGSNYYGSCESFLWRMRRNRRTPCETVRDRAELESDVEVFKWTGLNRNVQMCSSTKGMLAVGGGEVDDVIDKRLLAFGGAAKNSAPHRLEDPAAKTAADEDISPSSPPDFGLALNYDMSSGTTGRCITFGTPSSGLLAKSTSTGTFEVSNVEVWTMTPMCDVERAEKLELSRQFVFNSVAAQASIQPRRASKMARAA